MVDADIGAILSSVAQIYADGAYFFQPLDLVPLVADDDGRKCTKAESAALDGSIWKAISRSRLFP